jgi:hypothetical protein
MESLEARNRFVVGAERGFSTSRRGNRSGEWENKFARRLTMERTGGDGMQTSKSRFVYCLGPYIAAMISKGKRGAAGMAQVLLLRRVRMGGGRIGAILAGARRSGQARVAVCQGCEDY